MHGVAGKKQVVWSLTAGARTLQQKLLPAAVWLNWGGPQQGRKTLDGEEVLTWEGFPAVWNVVLWRGPGRAGLTHETPGSLQEEVVAHPR